jgi:N-methylhydantoinase A
MRAAIDIGGTFTDVILYDENNGKIYTTKVHTDPINPAIPFMNGLRNTIMQANTNVEKLKDLVHGTTIVTNTLLQGKGAKVGLLITKGFKDVLEIGRQQRPNLYNLSVERCPPLVPRNYIKEVQERIGADGEVVIPIDKKEARTKLNELNNADIESLAIVFLFSFKNPEHEKLLKSLAREIMPDKFIFISSQVLPEFREYERLSTTTIAAAVAPRAISYLKEIENKMKDYGWCYDNLLIMHSGGGTMLPKEAIVRPHTLIESGPAAGIIACANLSKILKLKRIISFDMGGTTAKAGTVLDRKPQYVTEYEVGGELHRGGRVKGSGYPVKFPMIDVAEIGAGAGSIAWIDSGGHLKVGPYSAEAVPGPACYGKGGKEPTVTDAHLVLNHLSSDYFLGGEMVLDKNAAKTAILEFISKPMDITLEEAAQGIIKIANSNMLRILQLVSVDRGYDPREFALIAYGGAGPLHACDLAEEMEIHRLIIPKLPGLFSTLGLLYADITADFVETVMLPLISENINTVNKALRRLYKEAEDFFIKTNVPTKSRIIKASIDLRYLGQNYELNVDLPNLKLSNNDLSKIRSRFNKIHETSYGYKSPEETIQIVNIRVLVSTRTPKPEIRPIEPSRSSTDVALHSIEKVYFTDGLIKCPIYRREKLLSGHNIEGPAIIQEKEATTLLKDDWKLKVDNFGDLILDKSA